MIELDENGKIPRSDELCRVYRVAGETNGKPWAGFNMWVKGNMAQAQIEAYDTFRGWATEEVKEGATSFEPAQNTAGRSCLRVGVECGGVRGPCFFLWTSEHGGQDKREQSPGFLRWATDTQFV